MIGSDRREIVEFFLNIFKVQMGISGRAGQYRLISEENGEQIFELRAPSGDQWTSRRMTLSPLGEESGSKSKCFKVIYDDMMVVKVPPAPITEFSDYVASIQAERRIARHLEPEVCCVTPSLSAILGKVSPFSNEPEIHSEAFEERCSQKIEILPVFQKYLQFGKSFAFFMNLSQYSFLGQVVADMHDITAAFQREISSQTEILGDPMMFEEVYGEGVFFELDGIYGEYEASLHDMEQAYDLSALDGYSRKAWFLSGLAGRLSAPENVQLPVDTADEVNALIKGILAAHPGVIGSFRKTMRKHVYQRRFAQNKARMGGIITNLIRLMAVLREKGIAMRDLKPDNVFIAGDLSGEPFLLETPENYSIGLIDFETAVILRQKDGDGLAQPMLAGTPSYSTISHMIPNEVLSRHWPSLARIFHLQDWYAVNAMIYNIVTGRHLSQEAGRIIPKMVKEIQQAGRKNNLASDLYRRYSCIFWRKAEQEFRRRLGRHAKMLREVRVEIPKTAREMLSTEVGDSQSALRLQIERLLKDSPVPLSSKDADGLSRASHTTLVQWRKRWEEGGGAPAMPGSTRQAFIRLLKRLSELRWTWEAMEKFIDLMKAPRPLLPADMLLVVIFNTVRYGMHKPSWEDRCSDGALARAAAAADECETTRVLDP